MTHPHIYVGASAPPPHHSFTESGSFSSPPTRPYTHPHSLPFCTPAHVPPPPPHTHTPLQFELPQLPHSRRGNSSWRVKSSGVFGRGQSCVVEALKPLRKGEALLMDYGPDKLDNTLLLDYGVLDTNNAKVCVNAEVACACVSTREITACCKHVCVHHSLRAYLHFLAWHRVCVCVCVCVFKTMQHDNSRSARDQQMHMCHKIK